MTKANKVPKPSVGALLNMAREYHRAANTLFPIAKDVTSPIYFLYAHTLELAFKTYLGSHGCSVPQIHDLESLCKSCQKHGLHVNRELANVIHLLESENKVHGFRYFAFVSTGIPEIGYLRQVVDDLMVTVAKDVERTLSKDSSKGVVLKFIVGKPEKKVQL
jgi:HEPN domain-containing protein